MKQDVTGDKSKSRLQTLEKIVKKNNLTFRQNNKTPLCILMETKKEDYYFGYDQFYNPMHIKSQNMLQSTWININSYNAKEDFNESII